jgi:transcriptional regulator with XRE-family HTH domain
MTFGQVVATARKRARLTQTELAAWIIKEDGRPISPRYLRDLEHDRLRIPKQFLIEQFAAVLGIPPDVLLRPSSEVKRKEGAA